MLSHHKENIVYNKIVTDNIFKDRQRPVVLQEETAKQIFNRCQEETLQRYFGRPIPIEETDVLYQRINQALVKEKPQRVTVLKPYADSDIPWNQITREDRYIGDEIKVEDGATYYVRAEKQSDESISVTLGFTDPDRVKDEFSQHNPVQVLKYRLRRGQPVVVELTGANTVIMEQAHREMLWSLKHEGLDPDVINKDEDNIFKKIGKLPQIYTPETIRYMDMARDFERPELGIIEKAFV